MRDQSVWLLQAGAFAALCTAPYSAAFAADTKINFRLDWAYSGYHAPFVVASEKGWYKDAGLAVSIEPAKGSVDTMQQVNAGNAEIGLPDGGVAARAISQGMDVKMVAMLIQDTPASIIGYTDNGVRSPKDMEGKTFARVPGGTTAQLLNAFMKLNNVDAAKVQFIDATFATMAPMTLSGQTAGYADYAFLGGVTFKSKSGSRGVNILPFSKYGIAMYANGIGVNGKFLAANPDAVRKFVQVSLRATRWTLDNKKEAIAILSGKSETAPEILLAQLAGSEPYIDNADAKRAGLGTMNRAKWQATLDLLSQYGGLAKPAKADDLFTTEYLPK